MIVAIVSRGGMAAVLNKLGAFNKVTKAAGKVKSPVNNVKKKVGEKLKKAKCRFFKTGCFVAGTLVLTSDGLQAIEDFKVGDEVVALNPETGEWGALKSMASSAWDMLTSPLETIEGMR